MDFCGKIITAPLIYLNGNFCENIQIEIDKNGRIKQIGENLRTEREILRLENLVYFFDFFLMISWER